MKHTNPFEYCSTQLCPANQWGLVGSPLLSDPEIFAFLASLTINNADDMHAPGRPAPHHHASSWMATVVHVLCSGDATTSDLDGKAAGAGVRAEQMIAEENKGLSLAS